MNAITPIVAARPLRARAGRTDPGALWTGRPEWRASAVRVWKIRWVAVYFALLLADGARIAAGRHAPAHAWTGEAALAILSLLVLGGLLALAALTQRTTRYTLGPRALTLNYGMALTATLVIPFAAIEHVGVRTHADGSGDLALRLKPGPRVIYPKLWPHVRPWRLRHPEPMLRCIPDAGVVAALLCRALAARDAQMAAAAPTQA